MKTEMKQLEENTKREKAKQQAETLISRIVELLRLEIQALRKRMRADVLFFATVVLYFALLIYGIVRGIDLESGVLSVSLTASYILFFFSFLRSIHFTILFQKAKSKREGFEEALSYLGLIEEQGCDCDECGSKKKKTKLFTSPFKRFKELFERLNSKDKKEVYA